VKTILSPGFGGKVKIRAMRGIILLKPVINVWKRSLLVENPGAPHLIFGGDKTARTGIMNYDYLSQGN
jgi:hypothetical protein